MWLSFILLRESFYRDERQRDPIPRVHGATRPSLRRWLAVLLLLPATAVLSKQVDPGCCTPTRDDFPKVGGNLGNQSFSALQDINKGNISRLGGAWLTRLEPDAPAMDQQSSVVAHHGTLYVETTQGRVLAIDGASGAIKWTYTSGHGISLRRGVAVGEGKVFTAGAGKHVIALDENSGTVIWDKVLDEPTISSQIKVAVTYYDGAIYVGSNDGWRGVALALRAATGEPIWKFYGTPAPGEFGADSWEGDSWKIGGACPWMNPAIDPELGLVYWTFGNARTGGPGYAGYTAVDGAKRGGANLFANSIVALDLKTGKRRWHFQSVHHDIWDMDGVMSPVLADIKVHGRQRAAVIYGSKTGMTYILDRADGSPLVGIEERAVPQAASQKTWPTQPYALGDPLVPLCVSKDAQDASRPVPNYDVGCLFTPHTDMAVITAPGTGGGADWSQESFDPHTGLIYIGAGLVDAAHSIPTGGIGFRPAGELRSGKIVAKDPANNKIVWQQDSIWSVAHGNGILTTAGDVLFIGQPDGFLVALDIRGGRELWRFQTGAGVHTNPISYKIRGVQYVAVFAGGNSIPYNSPRGDFLWAFKLDGKVPPAATPVPPPVRQPIIATPVPGTVAKNTVVLGRTWNAAAAAPNASESTLANAMAPQIMVVTQGTTVTFSNPADNATAHCATQFFEGLFKLGPLKPGESATYTFESPGEFFFNDCATPQSTGKIVVQ